MAFLGLQQPKQPQIVEEPEVIEDRDISEVDRLRRKNRQPSLLDLLSGDSAGPTIL